MPTRKKYPEPLRPSRLGGVPKKRKQPKHMTVLEKCVSAGYDPVEGLLQERHFVKRSIEELQEWMRIGGPRPQSIGEDESPNDRIAKLAAYGKWIDAELLPYCYPRLKSSEIKGENGNPVEVVIKNA